MTAQLQLVTDQPIQSDAGLEPGAQFKEFWKIWMGWNRKEKEPARILFCSLVTTGKTLEIEGERIFYKPTAAQLIYGAREFIEAEKSKPNADPQYTRSARRWLRNAGWTDYDLEDKIEQLQTDIAKFQAAFEKWGDQSTLDLVQRLRLDLKALTSS